MKRNSTVSNELENLADNAKALLAATGHVAEEKVVAARERLVASLDRGKQTWERVQDRAIERAKVADEAIREHPYQSAGIALGLGALIGFLLARRF